jgi:hypothetical protein
MKYYFDESGQFAVKIPGPHIMVGIAYPNLFDKKLKKFYDEFVNFLKQNEFEKGEPKGKLLQPDSREKLFSFISDNSWLKISVSLTDSEYNSVSQVQQYRDEQINIYKNQLSDPQFKSILNELNKLIKDFNRESGLSDVLIVKGLLLMHTLLASLIGSLEYFTEEVYDDDWGNFVICFDRLDKNTITKMEDWVMRDFINLFTDYSSKNNIELNHDWFTRNHPLLKNYRNDYENSLDLNKMFKDKILFEFSEKCFQLQIVDWISNSLFKVVKKELSHKYLDMIDDNLIKFNNTKIRVVAFSTTDNLALLNKYKDFLL